MKQPFMKKAVLISTLTMSTILSTTIPFNVLAESPTPAIQTQQENLSSEEIMKLSFEENLNDTIHAKALKSGRVVLTASTEDGKYNQYVYIQVK
ncbi:hypothetical protein [Bacillus gaemokensis]|uniref:Uncharacterized protein n=1 Tax=Bacillus gaemokensis TaxID=574375 RepID=A0A073KE51_9BACI|nr:hypothetical protein [Bacillus gaemokensis]KEK24850.1 hypothetical protein BAGA_21465 [Bacillus gaemokensis]KYG30162.1 hypothetical protein AZF08_12475 [Bacillus gaemokensis]